MRAALRRRSTWLLVFVWMSGEGSMGAEPAQSISPARLNATKRALSERIAFPNVEQDVSVLLMCEAVIVETGRLRAVMCFRRDNSRREFERAVLRGAAQAVAEPARVNGEFVSVVVHFSVLFDRFQGRESVDVYQHQFLDTEVHGVNYIAPQALLDSRRAFPRCRLADTIWMAYTVDEQGQAHAPVANSGDTAPSCVQLFEERVLRTRYLPAFVKNRPVAARVLEPFYRWDVTTKLPL